MSWINALLSWINALRPSRPHFARCLRMRTVL